MDILSAPEAAAQIEKWRSEYSPDIGTGTYWLIGFSIVGVIVVHLWPRKKLELLIVFDGSKLFNDISSPIKYGEQLLCRIYRIGVENKTNRTLRNVRVIVKNMILTTTGQIISHFIDCSLGATNREGVSFNLEPGAMERFDVLYAKDSKAQHGPEFNFTIDDNQLALCIPNRKPNAALFKEPYDITLQVQAENTLAVSRRFVTAIDDQGNVLFKPVDG